MFLYFQLTYEAVFEIDRTLRKLKSNLNILTVSKRIKTYTLAENQPLESEDECLANLKRNTNANNGANPMEVNNIEAQYIISDDSIDDHFVSVNDVGYYDDIKPIESMESSEPKLNDFGDITTEIENKKEISDIEMKFTQRVPRRRTVIKRVRRKRENIPKVTKEQREQILELEKGSRVKKTHKYNRYNMLFFVFILNIQQSRQKGSWVKGKLLVTLRHHLCI